MFTNTSRSHSTTFFPNIVVALLFLLIISACKYRVSFSSPLNQEKTSATGEISFLKTDFEMRLDSAQKAGQPVFIDFYTSWCGPCRTMDREVFTDSRVSAYFNESFLNLKINAEKGEGISLAKKFGIGSYPTMIFLDSNGLEKERIIGLTTASRLHKAGKKVKGV